MELPKIFIGKGEVKGFLFNQVSSNKEAYIYKVDNKGVFYYEVFRRVKTPICIDFEKRIYSDTEFKEVYPKSKQFGISAWSFSSIEKATEKFNTLKSID